MDDSEPFSRIQFPGIPKIPKPLLRAMKGNTPPPPPGLYQRLRNPFKKDEPQPKQIILTNNPHRYNPVTKQYEFNDDSEIVKEEFTPPPSGFTKTDQKGPVKKYVDVLGQDISLKDYKPTVPKEETPQVIFDEKKLFEEILKNDEKKNTEKIDLAEVKKFFESSFRDLQFVGKQDQDLLKFDGFENAKLENEILELNLNLIEKLSENLEISEKNTVLDSQIKNMKAELEGVFQENWAVLNKFKEENEKLSEEVIGLRGKQGSIDVEADNKIKELENNIEQMQLRISIDTKARVQSEINEKKLVITISQLEKDFSYALDAIKVLNKKNQQLSLENSKMASELLNTSIESSDTFEFFQLSSENLSLKKQLADFKEENSFLKQKEQDLQGKIKAKSSEIAHLEKSAEKISELQESLKGLEVEKGKLSSKFSHEKSSLLSDVKNLNITISELRKNTHELKIKENEYQIKLGEQDNKISALQLEISSFHSIQERLQEQDKQLRLNNSELKNEVHLLKSKNERLTEDSREVHSKLEESKENFDGLLSKHKSMVSDFEKKLLDLSKKHQSIENKLKRDIEQAEESNKILEEQLKVADEKIIEVNKLSQLTEIKLNEEISNLKFELTKEIQEKNSLDQEIKIVKESSNAEKSLILGKYEQQMLNIGKLEKEISENSGIRDENKKIKEENAELSRNKQELEELIKKTGEENKKLSKALNELTKKNSELTEKIEDIESEKNSLVTLLSGSSDEAQALNEKLRELQDGQSKLQETNQALENQLRSIKESSGYSISSLENEIKNLEKIIKSKESELAESLDLNKEVESSIQNLKEKYSSLEQENTSLSFLKSSVESQEKLNDSLLSEISNLKQSLEDANQKIEALESEKNDLNFYYEEELAKSENLKNELSEENIKNFDEINALQVELSSTKSVLENTVREKEDLANTHYKEIARLTEELKNQDQSCQVLELTSKIARLESELDRISTLSSSQSSDISSLISEKKALQNQVLKIQEEHSLTTLKSANLEKEFSEILNEKNELQRLIDSIQEEKKEMQQMIDSIEQDKHKPTLESMFSPSSLTENFSFNPDEKFELEQRVKDLEDKKSALQSQVDELTLENDLLLDKNLNLVNQNQFLQAENSKKSEFPALRELETRLKTKEEELKLLKENFQEFLQKISEKNQVKKPQQDEGWFSSVIGSIFLTDKERGID